MKYFFIAFAVALLLVSVTYAQKEPDKDCKLQFECQPHGADYWRDCFYDNKTQNCRCFVGEFSSCDLESSSMDLNDWCSYRFECQPHGKDFWRNCFYDPNIHDCRCYVGAFADCRLEKSAVVIEEPEPAEKNITEEIAQETEEEKEPGIFESAINRLRNFWSWFVGLQRFKSEGLVALVATVIVVGVLYYFLRDSPANNLRRARRYHKLAEKHHNKGNEEKAQLYYEMAEIHRERAR